MSQFTYKIVHQKKILKGEGREGCDIYLRDKSYLECQMVILFFFPLFIYYFHVGYL